MDATRLLSRRRVLAFLVAGELAVVGGLAALAWHVWQQDQLPGRGGAAASLPALQQGTPPQPSPATTMPASPRPGAAPTPGLRTDPQFLSRATLDVNREEAALEKLEWRIVQGAMGGIRAYIERVVLPAVARAQRQAGSS